LSIDKTYYVRNAVQELQNTIFIVPLLLCQLCLQQKEKVDLFCQLMAKFYNNAKTVDKSLHNQMLQKSTLQVINRRKIDMTFFVNIILCTQKYCI
jgi:hypothetical protein